MPTTPDPVSYHELFTFVRALAEASYSDARMDAANIVDSARALMKRGPSRRPDAATMRRLQRQLAEIVRDRPSLSDFLARVRDLHPALAEAAEGIYTGAEGRVTEPIAEWGSCLCFNWYSNGVRKHFVEWAYLS